MSRFKCGSRAYPRIRKILPRALYYDALPRNVHRTLMRERYKLLSVFVIGSVVGVGVPHDSDAFLKPDIFPSAAAEMAGKNVRDGFLVLRVARTSPHPRGQARSRHGISLFPHSRPISNGKQKSGETATFAQIPSDP